MRSGAGTDEVAGDPASATLALLGDLAEVARANDPGMAVAVAIHGTRSVKDAVESIGIPHTEVAAIAVDDQPADWGHRLVGGEQVYWPGAHDDALVRLVTQAVADGPVSR